MNNYQQLIRKIIETTPSWEKDGGGIRGRTLAPIIGGASGPNLMGDPIPQQFNQQRNELVQQQDESAPTLNLPATSGDVLNIPHPWQILLRTTEGSGTEYKIESASRLYSEIGSWNNIEVDGIGAWNGVSEGYVVLFGVVDNGVCTEASIQVQSTISDRIDFVDDAQTSFAAQLGYLYQEEDSWLVRQNAFHNFTLMGVCTNLGKSAIYPFAT